MLIRSIAIFMSIIEISSSRVHAEAPATQPLYAGSRMLRSESLAVEIMDPADPDRYYTGVRFTPIAGIIRAEFNGVECLFHAEKHDPKKDVAGLFAEFDLVTSPPGFDDAAIGEPFVKLGVGALKKTTEKYQFYADYPVLKTAVTRSEWTDHSATFRQTYSDAPNAYELIAAVNVEKNVLEVVWTLSNRGATPIKTQHYAHNSFRVAERTIGPGYFLSFPFDFAATGLKAEQVQTERTIGFRSVLEKPVNIGVAYPEKYAGLNSLNLTEEKSGVSIQCETSLPGARVAVHAAPQYICPEQFVEVMIEPGQSHEWRRKYIFNLISRAPQH